MARAVDVWRQRTQLAWLVVLGMLALAWVSPLIMAWLLAGVAVAFAALGAYAWLRWRRALIDAAGTSSHGA